jgi:acyl carrier protein
VLGDVTAGLGLEQFVLFSSGSAIWGSAMLGGYAAANAYLDALAAQRHAAGLPALSVAWGLWGGGGMAGGKAGEQLHRAGMKVMDPHAAVSALTSMTGTSGPLAVVADIDWAKFAPVFTIRRPSPLIGDLDEAGQALAAAGPNETGSSAGAELAARLAAMTAAEQERLLTGLVRQHAAAVLGHPSPAAVPAGTAFRDLGFDSLTAVELRDKLTTATGLSLPATMVFDHPSPAAAAEYLRAQFTDLDTGYPVVIEELEKLEQALSSITHNNEGKSRIADRLEVIIRGLRAGDSDEEPAYLALEEASDDEMFDLVERELNEP